MSGPVRESTQTAGELVLIDAADAALAVWLREVAAGTRADRLQPLADLERDAAAAGVTTTTDGPWTCCEVAGVIIHSPAPAVALELARAAVHRAARGGGPC